jgi:hypothetical protein
VDQKTWVDDQMRVDALSVLVRTKSWVDALRLAVDDVHSIDVGNVLEEAPGTHEKASIGVDEARAHIDQVEDHGIAASDE